MPARQVAKFGLMVENCSIVLAPYHTSEGYLRNLLLCQREACGQVPTLKFTNKGLLMINMVEFLLTEIDSITLQEHCILMRYT